MSCYRKPSVSCSGAAALKKFRGVLSGKDPTDPPLFLNRRLFLEPKSQRTLVPEVVAAIEARRQKKFSRKPARKGRIAQPRRKVIYDDFGEPLRRVWVDD